MKKNKKIMCDFEKKKFDRVLLKETKIFFNFNIITRKR